MGVRFMLDLASLQINGVNRAVSNLLSDSTWLLSGKVISLVANLGISFYLAKNLGQSVFGQYSSIMAYLVIMQVISTFGMDTYLIRLIAQDSENSIENKVWPCILLQLSISGIIIFLCILIHLCVDDQLFTFNSKDMMITSFLLIPTALATTFKAILKGLQKMKQFVVFDLLDAGLRTLVVISVVAYFPKITILVWSLAMVKVLSTLLLGIYIQNDNDICIDWSKSKLSRNSIALILKSGSYLLLSVVIVTIFRRLEILTITIVGTPLEVGNYAVSNRIIEASKLLPAAFYSALFPVMVKKTEQNFSLNRIVLIVFSLSLLLTLLIWLFSEIVISSYLENYKASIEYLKILSLGLIPFVIRQYFSFQLVAHGYEKQVFILNILVLFLAIIAYPVFYFISGVIGICWAADTLVITEVIIYYTIQRRLIS